MSNHGLMVGAWVAVLSVSIMTAGARGSTYHVATHGADSNEGAARSPFRTIQRAAQVMKAGDTCLVRAGVYRETVRPQSSGQPGRPITFAAYRDEKVIVSGADPIAGWRRAEKRIYAAPGEGDFDQLFVDGRMMNQARWPNAPLDPMRPVWATAGAGTTPGSIVDPQLPDIALEGAALHVLPGVYWVTWTRAVAGRDAQAHILKFNADWSQEWAYVVKEGTRYYLFGAASLLDAPGEWHLDRERKVVRLWAPESDDPARHLVEAKRRALAFDLSARSHVSIEGFRIFAAGISMADAEHCQVRNCHLRYACHFTQADGWGVPHHNSGVLIGGRDNVFCDSSVIYSAGNGIALLGENNAARNCLVRRCDYMAGDYGAVWAEGTGNIIAHNTLSETGRSVLLNRFLKKGRIEYNDMHDAGLLTHDLGITYCFATDGEGTVIAHNFAHHNRATSCGVGIYIDNASSNFVIHHNVSWANQDSGLRINTPSRNTLIYNNTVVGNGDSLNYWGAQDNKDQAGCRAINNILTDKVRTGDGMEAEHNFTGKDPGFINARKADFHLRVDSPCIDAGVVLPGITDGFTGKAPDLGAFERGAPPWKAGHDWGDPPTF